MTLINTSSSNLRKYLSVIAYLRDGLYDVPKVPFQKSLQFSNEHEANGIPSRIIAFEK